ncbi:MAG: hypothetical protein ACPGT1_09640, partial [Ilumatobacteraceae bacterium]
RHQSIEHSTSSLRQTVAMRFARRIVSALIMTIAAAGAIRVKGRGGTPPRHGGWRPVRIPPDDGGAE